MTISQIMKAHTRFNSNVFSSKSPNSVILSASARWVKDSRHHPVRSFAVSSSEKIKVQRKKRRLDEVCVERFQQYSRSFIQSWIMQGKVSVDGTVVNKSGTPISDKAVVEINAEVPKYVCRAGHKLEAAIEQLEIDVIGKVALDSGLSTGGFTDCLLQYGASFVYGVDVGYGQVADKIRQHDCVSVIDRTNLRYLSELPQKVDLVTLDLSFISILTVMPAVVNLMKNDAILVTLIKPQFEAHRSQHLEYVFGLVEARAPKARASGAPRALDSYGLHAIDPKIVLIKVGGGGIVRDPLVHKEVLAKIVNGVQDLGFQCKGWIESPLKGADGNQEFLASFSRTDMEDAEIISVPKADIAKLNRVIGSTRVI
ncbi:hypothetical protein OROHE_016825 [Orobanche hederae]